VAFSAVYIVHSCRLALQRIGADFNVAPSICQALYMENQEDRI